VARAVVTIAQSAGIVTVPRSFLGISTEYWGLPLFERQQAVLERTLTMLRPQGDGPLMLRIGGDSADHSFWAPKLRPLPTWAYELTPEWLRETSALVQSLGLRVILDLNLVTEAPTAAAQWAEAAEAQLPAGSISAFEIGNEPDIYNRQFWQTTLAHSKVVPPIVLTARTYAHDFQAYARALRAVAPGLPLIGPALANPSTNRRWITTLLASRPAHVSMVSVHRYPYSACALPGTAAYATIPRVLGEHASAGVARSVAPAVAIARRAGVPVRVTELNSVTCGGRAGVSDAFATALWAPDALFELLRARVAGVNIHVRARAVNAAFTIGAGGLDAKPLLYGLVGFARMLGPGAQLIPLRVGAGRAVHLKAWGVRVRGDALHVLLIDKGGQPVDVSLRLPGVGGAVVERLLAPSVGARSGVTLAGQYLDVSGTWRGRVRAQTIRPGAYGYAVAMPRYSAALLTLRLRAGALGGGVGVAAGGRRVRRVSVGGRVPAARTGSRTRSRTGVGTGAPERVRQGAKARKPARTSRRGT
jgi:hypothetical protein